jgi:predicted DNA-binding transcriptional regulator AlpA
MKSKKTASITINEPLPPTGFLRLPEVLALIPVGKSTLYAWIASGRFPPPVKLGRCSAWRVEDIRAHIQSVSAEKDRLFPCQSISNEVTRCVIASR